MLGTPPEHNSTWTRIFAADVGGPGFGRHYRDRGTACEHAAETAAFGRIHGGIGQADQGSDPAASVDKRPRRCSDPRYSPAHRFGTARQCPQQFIHNRHHIALPISRGQQNPELVAPQAAHQVGPARHTGHLTQQTITSPWRITPAKPAHLMQPIHRPPDDQTVINFLKPSISSSTEAKPACWRRSFTVFRSRHSLNCTPVGNNVRGPVYARLSKVHRGSSTHATP